MLRGILVCLALAVPVAAQQPLAPRAAAGQSVTPVYEGWYRNPDGTFSLSFGYYSRNATEVIDVPTGPDNNFGAGSLNWGQPTRFHPGRHWGVFAVVVPAEFGATRRVTWTLKNRGQVFSIPGRLHPDWQIDALEGEASSANTPPALRFAAEGAEGRGPGGITTGPVSARVGVPLVLPVWVRDDGRGVLNVASSVRRDEAPVTLTWFVHQGPGTVAFSPGTARVAAAIGTASTTVTFHTAGDYVVRIRANDASGVTGAGHAQCCWTNGFVKVTVTP